MPIKLQVAKEGDDTEPADYLFEQDRILIGRGSDNDLTLPDQKISTAHAVIESREGQYLLFDQESKNHTYIHGERVGEEEPYVLQSGDVLRIGDFNIEFVPLFMPSSEQTAYADPGEQESNPFTRHASQLASAIEGLAETYTYAPQDGRDDSFADALDGQFDDDLEGHPIVDRLVQMVDRSIGSGQAAETPPPESTNGRASPGAGSSSPSTDAVIDALLESVARMVSIPTHFWREFSGNTVVHPPEKAFIHRSSVDSLREHLLDDDLSQKEREERLDHLREAVDTLVAHNVAMLAGYKKAVMAGSKDLLQTVNPIDAVEEAQDARGGVLGGLFGGTKADSELEALNQRWKELFHGEWGALEKEHFRPTYVDTYLERMAKAWDVDKEDIRENK